MAENSAARRGLPLELRGLDIAGRRAMYDGFDGITRAINTAGVASTERKGHQDALLLNDAELVGAYRQNWLAMDAVQRPAEDIVRAWWDVQSSDNPEGAEEVEEWIKRHNIRDLFQSAITWARLYGGAAIVLGIDDGKEPHEPVDYARIRSIRWARVVDRRYCHVRLRNRDSDSWNFNLPEIYTVGMRYEGARPVHVSRLLAFTGEPLPDDYRDQVDGWGDSVLERSWDAISRYQTAARSLTIACEKFIQSTFKVADLASWVTSDEGGALALQRLHALNQGLHTGNIAMIDGAVEEFERQGLPMTGLTDTLKELRQDVAGALRRPVSQIFGQQQGTTRTGADGDAEVYHASVRSMGETNGEPQLHKLIDLLAAAKDGPLGGAGLDFSLAFGSLSQPKPKAEAETLDTQADAITKLINAGVVYPSEARAALTGEGSLIVPDDEVTAAICEAEMMPDPDGEDMAAKMAGVDPKHGAAMADSARPESYAMADGADRCAECASRIVADGSPWCDRYAAMVSDGFVCDAFGRDA